MDKKIKIIFCIPILAVFVTIVHREINKEPPINYESYKRMPPLYAYDDYDDVCIQEYKDQAKYCVANIIIDKDETSDLWHQIEEFSSQERFHFRHDILKWGFCLNNVRQNITKLNIKNVQTLSDHNHFEDNVRFRQLGKVLREYDFDKFVEIDVQSFVTYKFKLEYGLTALSNVTFCVSQTVESQDQGYSVLKTLFTSFVVLIFYSTLIATIIDLCCNTDATVYPKNIYTSISLRTNINRLFRDPNPNELGFLNGVKVLGEVGVLVVHTAYILLAAPTAISFDIESQMYDPIVGILRSGIFQLQNFFAITAFLSFYPSMSRILKGEKLSQKDIVLLVIKRIVRLWPVIIIVVLFSSTILYRVKDGPVWIDAAGTEMLSCRNHWWTNLLFINNFYGADSGPCLQQSWHLAAEMQLFVVELFVILLISYFPSKVGTIIVSVFALGNFITGLSLYREGITGLVLGRIDHIRTRNALDREFQKGHIPFYSNTPGYCLGLLAAYVHFQIKQKKFDLSSKTKFFKIWYFIFLTSGLILLHHSFYADTVSLPSLWIAIYTTLCKNIGAIVTVTLLIFMGDVNQSESFSHKMLLRATGIPIIDSFLLKVFHFYNHRVFKILVKLNLGVFLVHPFVAMFIITDGKHLVTYGTKFDIAWIGLGTLVGSYIIAAVLFVMVEMPIINLFRLFLYKNQKIVMNGKLSQNSIVSNGKKVD